MTTGGMMRTIRRCFRFMIAFEIKYRMGQDAGGGEE